MRISANTSFRRAERAIWERGTLLFLALIPLILSSCAGVGREVVGPSPAGEGLVVASWYGAEFHGRPTSSGQIFDMHGLTCAHREFPFGTRLRITHLLNNKSVDCVVNDRGPFIEGRDVDLSYGAAKEIGLLGPGVSPVVIEVTGRDPLYVHRAVVRAWDRKGPFAIQLGAFTDSLNAVRMKAALKMKYEQTYIEETEVRGIIYHRVRIGDFDDLGTALTIAEALGQEGYQPVVVRPGRSM